MIKRIAILLWLALVITGTFSCKKDKNRNNFMPPITGRRGEITLVMKDALYNGPAGDTIYAILCQEEPALPQSGMQGAEPMFDLLQIPPSSFGNVFKANRNILIISVVDSLVKPVITIERDYWAKHQLLIRMAAPDKDELIEFILSKQDLLINTIRDAEIDREVYLNNKYENTELVSQLKRRHQLLVHFPKGWEPRIDTGNFVWVEYDPPEITQGILIHYYPYTDKSQIDYENLIIDTEEWLKTNVPGPSDGSFMSLEMDAPLYSKVFTHKGHYTREIKGLWEMQNDYMGGPFISWSIIDEKHKRIVTFFGFVYAPKYKKRNHIRKVESLLKTVEFTD